MHHWPKRIFMVAAPLLLTGCLWGPGKFTSQLTLRRDGSFILDYRGEMVLQIPSDTSTKPWSADMANCYEGVSANVGHVETVLAKPGGTPPKKRACSAAETAKQKAEYEKTTADRRKQAEQAAAMFGLPGLDDASNRAFAAKVMKYAGWRSVTYRGNGVFDVDYH